MLKAAFRKQQLSYRLSFYRSVFFKSAEEELNKNIKSFFKLIQTKNKTVAGYKALTGEPAIDTFMAGFVSNAQRIALPAIRADKMVFVQWDGEGSSLMQNEPYKFLQPKALRPILQPDFILTPLVAFDLRGTRLGLGKGFYDRTLAAIKTKRAVKIVGVAFSWQCVSQLPLEKHDVKLDIVITERDIFYIS